MNGLNAEAEAERVHLRNDRPTRNGQYVLYWMQASQRASWNPALEHAIALGDQLGVPVVACFGLTPDYPEANLRSYAFLLGGLEETARALAERGLHSVLRGSATRPRLPWIWPAMRPPSSPTAATFGTSACGGKPWRRVPPAPWSKWRAIWWFRWSWPTPARRGAPQFFAAAFNLWCRASSARSWTALRDIARCNWRFGGRSLRT